jgi:hypothetical protein
MTESFKMSWKRQTHMLINVLQFPKRMEEGLRGIISRNHRGWRNVDAHGNCVYEIPAHDDQPRLTLHTSRANRPEGMFHISREPEDRPTETTGPVFDEPTIYHKALNKAAVIIPWAVIIGSTLYGIYEAVR